MSCKVQNHQNVVKERSEVHLVVEEKSGEYGVSRMKEGIIVIGNIAAGLENFPRTHSMYTWYYTE